MVDIDLNADLGETALENDASLMPYISSANIACGFHAGDPLYMAGVVDLCKRHAVAVGAHPSYWDRDHFGRRALDIPSSDIYQQTLYQIGALQAITHSQSVAVGHVKPHGALYNRAAVDLETAEAIAQAVFDTDAKLILVGLANSRLIAAGKALGLATASEGFVDRRYTDDGLLIPRSHADALISDETEALSQALAMVLEQRVCAASGKHIALSIQTLCLHGDGAHALRFAQALRKAFADNGIAVRAVTP
jgi:5-oxoprolinase (ATP-hydrolysing) subunit A